MILLDGSVEKRLVAEVPYNDYNNVKYNESSGMLVVPLDKGIQGKDLINGTLSVVGSFNGQDVTLLDEDEWRIITDKFGLYFEFPNPKTGKDYSQVINFQTFRYEKFSCVYRIDEEFKHQQTFISTNFTILWVCLLQLLVTSGYPNWQYNFESDPGNVGKKYFYPSPLDYGILQFAQVSDKEKNWNSTITLTSDKDGKAQTLMKGQFSGESQLMK